MVRGTPKDEVQIRGSSTRWYLSTKSVSGKQKQTNVRFSLATRRIAPSHDSIPFTIVSTLSFSFSRSHLISIPDEGEGLSIEIQRNRERTNENEETGTETQYFEYVVRRVITHQRVDRMLPCTTNNLNRNGEQSVRSLRSSSLDNDHGRRIVECFLGTGRDLHHFTIR